MRAWILVGVFILLYQPTEGKPLKSKAKTESKELIREKREEVEDDERSGEMQKFMLDLSSKEDMSRLRERFKSGTSQDIENDAEYRRLRRFSIHDSDDDKKSMTSGKQTMDMRSSGTSSSDGSKHDTESHDYKSKHSEDKTQSNSEHSTDNSNDKNIHEVDITRRNTADSETAGSLVNSHHIVGGSWELIHHYPTRSLSSFTTGNTTISNNTTMQSEYLQDDVMDGMTQYDSDDVTQYERAGKSRRKPRVSQARPGRSVEPDYEMREISEIQNHTPEISREDDDVEMLNTRAIKRDGYIGCFIDQHPKRDLKKMFTVNNLTPESCRSVCKGKGHAYAGVQYGYLCHCGDEYGKYGEAGEHECNSACLGDEGRKCGGFWRNSVYTSDISDETIDQNEDTTNERETRSRIDRVIDIPQSEREEQPVQQEITVYLRAEIPKPHEHSAPEKHALSKDVEHNEKLPVSATNSKRTEIPSPTIGNQGNKPTNAIQAKKKTDVSNYNAYLHPQTSQKEFVPSNVVLKALTASPEQKKYTGFIKLKQNWDDGLRNKRSPKTLILAGNIESAFAEMFADDPLFEKAEVLSLREASIRDNPDTVHKVMVEFALVFHKEARKKDKNLRNMVESNRRVGDMPVFPDSLDVKEYDNKQEDEPNTDEAAPKEKRQDGVDAFLEEVFRQI